MQGPHHILREDNQDLDGLDSPHSPHSRQTDLNTDERRIQNLRVNQEPATQQTESSRRNPIVSQQHDPFGQRGSAGTSKIQRNMVHNILDNGFQQIT